jgi:hypothetical protein
MVSERRRGYHIEVRSAAPSAPGAASLTAEASAGVHASAENEVLLIDGKVVPYAKTQEGFRIYYQAPEKDLLTAARSYVDTQREKSK